MNKTFRALIISALVLILVLLAFGGGVVVDRFVHPSTDLGFVAPKTARGVGAQVDEVLGLLRSEALNPPSETSATAGSIQGLLDSTGDKYAMYFDARHFKYFNEQNSGQFGGIGVTIGEKDGRAYVTTVMAGTPAAKAGMRPNDVFVQIDAVRHDKWTSEEIVTRVRGDIGTKVKIVVRRGSDLKTFTVTRATIEFPNINSRILSDGIGYIRLYSFNQHAEADLRVALDKLKKKGAKGFVVDLRDNPGGLLDQAIRTSSLFVPNGVIVRVDERNKPEKVYRATGKTDTGEPVVLLVNGNSASASEIMGGALQDHKRAKLVGETSYGKGSVQTVEDLSGGAAVKFTIAHYLTPNKQVINGKGLTPDYVVKMKPANQYDPQFQKVVAKDAQLMKAVEVLKQEL